MAHPFCGASAGPAEQVPATGWDRVTAVLRRSSTRGRRADAGTGRTDGRPGRRLRGHVSGAGPGAQAVWAAGTVPGHSRGVASEGRGGQSGDGTWTGHRVLSTWRPRSQCCSRPSPSPGPALSVAAVCCQKLFARNWRQSVPKVRPSSHHVTPLHPSSRKWSSGMQGRSRHPLPPRTVFQGWGRAGPDAGLF